MTDDAPAYGNAWEQVMGPPAHRLLCVWHVDRAWRKNLPKIQGDGLLKANVYKTLRTLMELSCIDTFKEKLGSFVDFAQEDLKTAHFAQYFVSVYANRPQLWAYCYRNGLHVHHNMHLEAMHRVLKHVHMQGRKVRRMDRSLGALMRLLEDKNADILLKAHRGKWTMHLLGIRQRHRKGVALNADGITILDGDQGYMVPGKAGEAYIVQIQAAPHDPATCALRCSMCHICVHSITCTCIDSGLRTTICKHAHLVVNKFKLVPPIAETSGLSNDEVATVY